MKLVGSANQQLQHYLYDASGTTTGSAQLVLAKSMSRSYLRLKNVSDAPIYYEIGSARGVATISNGAVTGVSISSPAGATNAGFNYTNPPVIRFLGGGNQLGGGNVLAGGIATNSSYLGLNQPGGSSPSHPAAAHCVLTSNAVSSVVIDDPGAGYVIAPYVLIFNSDLDPYGAAVPTAAYSDVLAAGDYIEFNGTCCPTDPVAILGSSSGLAFICKWMD